MKDTSGFVLAGGKSTRMGRDKALLPWGERTLLDRALHTLRAVANPITIVGHPDKFAQFGRAIPDVYEDRGPLGGIHAALSNSHSEWNLVIAVDMPMITPALLKFLVAESKQSGAIVTACRLSDGWQPLCAVYRAEFLDRSEKALVAGQNKVETLFLQTRVREVSESELLQAGFSPQVFRNVNTPNDLIAAERDTLEQGNG